MLRPRIGIGVVTLLSLALAAMVTPAASQVLSPIPRVKSLSELPVGTFWGQGRTESSDKSEPNPLAEPSGKFISTIYLADRLSVYMAANKGVGSGGAKDSLSMSALAFPETSNNGLIAKAQWDVPWNRHLKRGKLSVPIFVQYSFQQYDLTVPDDADSIRSFNTSAFHIGTGLVFSHYDREDPLRLSLLASVTTLHVTDATVLDYREFYGEPRLASKLLGVAIKLGLQFNDFGFEFGFANYGRPEGKVGGDLVGGVFQLAFTANAKILDVGKDATN